MFFQISKASSYGELGSSQTGTCEKEAGTVRVAVYHLFTLALLPKSPGRGDRRGAPPPRVIQWLPQTPHPPPDGVMVFVPTEPEWCAHSHQLCRNSKPPRQEAAPIPGNGADPPDPVSFVKHPSSQGAWFPQL